MPPKATPAAPTRQEVDPTWDHHQLFESVSETIYALPALFESDLVISGVLATDLFTFNTSLGATIESQVVTALNRLRGRWDPDNRYIAYSFVRQPQTFPDVTLRSATPGANPRILMGIELKGWYVLAKEREPSFRFKVTPQVCAPCDLLVVYPWALSDVVSGSPQLFSPFVEQARYAAEYRNWHWQHGKVGRGGDTSIRLSAIATSYPSKSDEISDTPASDKGGNFGRIARVGIMDEYMTQVFKEELVGIPLDAWQRFLSVFSEEADDAVLRRRLEQMAQQLTTPQRDLSTEELRALREHVEAVVAILGGDD